MKRTIFILLFISLAFSCCNKSEKRTEPEICPTDYTKDTVRILFVGNSLTLDATYELPFFLHNAGIKNIELTRTFHGAYTVPLYNTNFYNNDICAINTWKSGQNYWRGDLLLTHSPQEAASLCKYDIVCIQEYSGSSCAWTWNETEKAAITGLIQKIKACQADNEPEFIFMFSHTFGKGQETLVKYFDDDNTKQFEKCAQVYSAMMKEVPDFKGIVSPGATVQNLRTTGLNKVHPYDLTRGDATHSDYGLTRFAEAATLFKYIITPITGKKVEDISFRIGEYYPHWSTHMTPVTEENFPIIMKAVQASIDSPLNITDMSSYSLEPSYTHKPAALDFDMYQEEPVHFPVSFTIGNGSNNAYSQPYWSGYGLWFSASQPQAHARWIRVSDPKPGFIQTRSWASTTTVSSIGLRGIWTGDYFEFVLPVKDLPAGSKIKFTAPFYQRQAPLFWYFEWKDGDEWKCEHSTISSWDGKFSADASFALQLGTTSITRTATFSNEIKEGCVRIRIRCADGTIQADTATSASVKRDAPNISGTDYSSVFYFAGGNNEVKFELL